VFCACKTIQLFSVMSCVLSAAHKFDFRHVINETHDKWRTVEGPCSDIFMFLTGSV
jgi:hypothetical protein